MIRKAAAFVLAASLVLAGISVGEDAITYLTKQHFFTDAAHAVTSTGAVTLSTNVQTALTFSLATGTLPFGNLTPGTPIAVTSSASITTNNATGITMQVNRNNNPSSTLVHSDATTGFPDATTWNGSNATTTNLVGANLHFKIASTGTDAGLYNSTFWGSNDTDGAGNAKYAGFPTAAQAVASNSTYVGTTQTVVQRYRIDAPTTQKSGAYSGGVTYTVFTNP
jgi:hypothetical protein